MTSIITDSVKEDFLRGVHQPEDVYKIALFTERADLGQLTVLYSSLNESSGIGYLEGGIALVGYAISTDSGKAILTFNDPVWEVVSVTSRKSLIYNSSKANKAIAVLDFGENVTSTNAPFQIMFPPATAKEGLIRIS